MHINNKERCLFFHFGINIQNVDFRTDEPVESKFNQLCLISHPAYKNVPWCLDT
jgi:hypothetical protein